jgi:hypothetical protein
MLDPTAFVALDVASRVMAEQFSEQEPSRERSTRRPVRSGAARALRSFADALEPVQERPRPA